MTSLAPGTLIPTLGAERILQAGSSFPQLVFMYQFSAASSAHFARRGKYRPNHRPNARRLWVAWRSAGMLLRQMRILYAPRRWESDSDLTWGSRRVVSSDADEERPTMTTFLPLNGQTLYLCISKLCGTEIGVLTIGTAVNASICL